MDTPISVEVLNTFNALENPTLKNMKGAAFRYFTARYKEKYGFNYTAPSIPGDIKFLGELIKAHSFEDVIFILEMYVANYEMRFKSPKYPLPKIQGLRYKIDILINDLLEKHSVKEEKSDLEGLWVNG